jgi:hypothetical protein
MQLTPTKSIADLEENWLNATHPEDRHYYFTIAAQQCQDNGQRLYVNNNGRWAIATK